VGLAESDRRARSNSAQPFKGPGARLTNGLKCQRNDGVGRAAPHQGFHARAAPHRGMRTDPYLFAGTGGSATVSAASARRSPIGTGGPVVVSRLVCFSDSALISAPSRMM
jgi:hypothetical protein